MLNATLNFHTHHTYDIFTHTLTPSISSMILFTVVTISQRESPTIVNHWNLHTFSITYATADSCLIHSHLSWLGVIFSHLLILLDTVNYTHTHIRFLCIAYSSKDIALHRDNFSFMDNSGKVWLIRTSIFFYTHTHTHSLYYSALNGKLWLRSRSQFKV